MKQLFLLLCVLSYTFASSQIKKGITSEEEFNYMSKGYKTQLESGLDMKNGYSVDNGQNIESGAYSFTFIKLFKNVSNDITNVGTIVKAKSNNYGNTYWFCIPVNNNVLLEKSINEINKLDEPMTTAFFNSYLFYKEYLNK